mgnify:CR=1 FL=1
MRLKRLEIHGFKSFPEKLLLEINPGITVFVGPNGCGKSNISDAIRWVLGEQSLKNLRGSKMEDVIFSGTEYKKQLGLAEVSLTIDNSDRSLPLEYTEINITRRAYRSGESEYLINKTPCRLKDIHELFMDTGVGRDGYSIIGQGRIDEILSNKPESRRHVFEEASGIMKYKTRKIESEKKLELTSQNLLRINDIINEIKNMLEPLKDQSDIAKSYLNLRDKLKELEVNSFLINIEKHKSKLEELESNYSDLKKEIDDENRKLEEVSASNLEKMQTVKTYENNLERIKNEYYKIESNLERSSSEIALNDEKTNNLIKNIDRIKEETYEIKAKLNNLDEEEISKDTKINYLNKDLDKYVVKLEEAEKNMQNIVASLNETEKYIESVKSDIMDKIDLLSDKKLQMGNIKTHIQNIDERKNALEKEVYELKLEKDREQINGDDLFENIKKASENINKIKDKLETLDKETKKNDSNLVIQNQKLSEVINEMHIKSTRKKMLEDMERNLEGYARSVKSILLECDRSKEFGKGIFGALAQLIKVDGKFETAVESALGSALQNIVTDNEESAKKAINFLKEKGFGRATFLPVTSVKSRYLEDKTLDKLKKNKAFLGTGSDLVKYKNTYEGIILNLLGKTAVVDNLDNAIQMAREFKYSFKIVTLEGDVLYPGGSLSGGRFNEKSTGILGRSREINEINSSIPTLKRKENMISNEIEKINKEIERNKNIILNEENEMKKFELIKIRDESHYEQIKNNIKKLEAKIEMFIEEKNQIRRQKLEATGELEKYLNEIDKIEEDIENKKSIVSSHQAKQKENWGERDNLYREISDYKISVNSIRESIEGVKEYIRKIHEEKESLVDSINKKELEMEKNKKEKGELSQKSESVKKKMKSYEEEKTGKTFEIDRIIEERKVLEEELSDIVKVINDINKRIILLNENHSKIEVKKAKLESEVDIIINRMWDEYELTYTKAQEIKKDIGSISKAQKKIYEYKNQIKDLGDVNVNAIEEYVKTKERYDFMIKQKEDMEETRKKLAEVIREITDVMKKQFMEKFNLINSSFNTVFNELFDGGRAQLVLEDSEKVLETGIEIVVQPPGKKLQKMMLLSGGERALVAIAILFAILRLKPVPFCVLDEIEAALDESNVFRFTEYIKRFVNETQFIIITHKKVTMETANTLYGVTMQERGISKVVSMILGDKAS